MAGKNGRLSKRSAAIICIFIIALAAIFLIQITDFYEPVASREAASPSVDSGLLEAYYIDVGQGDCELLRIPTEDGGRFNMLIDCGEATVRDEVCAELKSLGITRLDAVVVSHPHADHMGGMATVIRNFEIGSFYMTEVGEDVTPTTVSYEKMLDAITEKGFKIKLIAAGDTIEGTGMANTEVLAPEKGDESGNLNNYSAVIKVTYGDTSFLYMGDAETEEFNAAIQSGYDLDADVLKVGHHGSHNATSKKLLQVVTPDIAVISCGKDNDYGHPHQETLGLLKKNGVEVYRTDEAGTVLIESDGVTLKVA